MNKTVAELQKEIQTIYEFCMRKEQEAKNGIAANCGENDKSYQLGRKDAYQRIKSNMRKRFGDILENA